MIFLNSAINDWDSMHSTRVLSRVSGASKIMANSLAVTALIE